MATVLQHRQPNCESELGEIREHAFGDQAVMAADDR